MSVEGIVATPAIPRLIVGEFGGGKQGNAAFRPEEQSSRQAFPLCGRNLIVSFTR